MRSDRWIGGWWEVADEDEGLREVCPWWQADRGQGSTGACPRQVTHGAELEREAELIGSSLGLEPVLTVEVS